MSGFNVSPGAYFREIDLSDRVASISTSIGAAVIEADWGEADKRTLCTSTEDYMANFGKPKPKYLSNYTTMRMLEVTKRCYVTRVTKNALQGGLIFAKAPTYSTPTPADPTFAISSINLTGVGALIGDIYAVGDVLTVTNGVCSVPAKITVDTVDINGGILTYTITQGGVYTLPPDVGTLLTVSGGAGAADPTGIPASFSLVGLTAIPLANSIPVTTGVTSLWAPMIIGEPDPETTLVMSNDMVFCLYDKSPGDHDIRASIELNTAGEGGFKIAVYLGNSAQPVETWPVSLERRMDGFGRQLYMPDVINPRSTYVGAIVNDQFDGEIDDTLIDGNFNRRRMQGGAFGDRVGSAEVILGWELYRDPESVDINILINGGFTDPAVQGRMDDIARDRADCIAVLDMPSDMQKVNNAINYRKNIASGAGLGIDSSYSAIYSPDLKIYDPYNATELFIPPSGHAAAAYAYTDKTTKVWFSPAGMKRGVLNIRGVREVYNQGARDALWTSQINPVRVIPGSGFFIWGDTTLQTRPSALQYVNVRRMMCFIEKSISITLQYFVFDPNDSILRATIKSIIRDFMLPIKIGRGVLDFEIVVDERNNPSYVTDEGILNVDVYIKPVLSARIIQLTAVITKQGSSFSEMIDSGITLG